MTEGGAGRRRTLVAALFVAVLALIAWLLLRDEATTAPPPTARAPAPAPAPPPRRQPKTEAPPETPAPPPKRAVDPPATRTLRVVVVADVGGAPIAGARVHVSQETDATASDALTAADGSAVASIERGPAAEVVVSKDGFGTARRSVYTNSPDEMTVALAAGLVVRGRVVFADTREPAGGVPVRAWDTGKMSGPSSQAVLDDVKTGADGRFEMSGVPRGREFRVAAAKPGFRTVDATLTLTEPGPEIELVLGDGGVLFGVVYGDDGAPLADVDVFQVPAGMDALPQPPDDGPFRTFAQQDVTTFLFPPVRTDAAGAYEFRGVRLPIDGTPQPRQAVARRPDGVTARGEPATFTRHGERQQRDVRFVKAASITLVVKAKSPPPDAAVRCQAQGGSPDIKRPLPADGSPVVFSDLPTNFYFVSVSTGDRARAAWEITRNVQLEDGRPQTVEIDLDATSAIDGRVVDSDARPVAGLRVEFFAFEESGGLTVNSEQLTGSDGSFRLTGLAPLAGKFKASADHFAEVLWEAGRGNAPPDVESAEREDVRPGGPPLVIVVRRLGKLAGRVTPVPTNKRGFVRARVGADQPSAFVRLADDGKFECRALCVGRACVACFDFGDGRKAVVDLPAVPSGETRDLGEIVVSAGAPLVCRVVDAANRPVAAAEIETLDDPAVFCRTSTDADGRFRIEGVQKHALFLKVGATRATPMTVVRVDPTAPQPTIVVAPGALVSGRVLDAAGKAVAGAYVSVVPLGIEAADAYDLVQSDAEGRYAVRVQAGRAKLAARAPDERRPGQEIEASVADGETRTLDLRLP